MSRKVEFFYDIVSPASYLAFTQMPQLAKDTGADIVYRPFFLPGLFKAAGSTSPITVPAKGKWLFDDLKRHAAKFGVPFVMNKHFPPNSLYVMRGLVAWQDKPEIVALTDGFYRAMWVRDEDINDATVVRRVVEAASVDPEEWQAAINDPDIKQKIFDITDEAKNRGMFGAPTFFVGEEMHWGQDRLEFVKEALKREG